MRLYDIVSGILLILSVIDFALAAPVLVQEKRQAWVDVVHLPKDVITVLDKRGDEELEKLAAEYFNSWERPIDSSDGHASSSSAPLGPDHGSTDVVQAPGPNPPSSTGNSGPLTEPSSPSSIAPTSGSFEDRFNAAWDNVLSNKGSDASPERILIPGSSEYGLDYELTGAHAPNPNPNPNPDFDDDPLPPPPRPALPQQNGFSPEHPEEYVQLSSSPSTDADPDFWNPWTAVDGPLLSSPRPGLAQEYGFAPEQVESPRPSTDPDPDFDWNHWNSMSLDDHDPLPPSPRPALPPNPRPLTGPDPNFDNHWTSLGDPLPPSPRPALAKEDALAPEHQMENVQQPNPGPSSSPPPEPDHGSTNIVQSPALNPASSTATPGPLVDPSIPSSTVLIPGSWDHFNELWDDRWSYKPGARVPLPNTNPRPSNELDSDLIEPEHDMVKEPPPSPELTDPELQLDHQPLSTDSQLVGLQDAAYEAKGKAKESRRISGTARDVGNAVQRELQSTERSLDTREYPL